MHTFSSTSNLTSATDIKWVAEADRLQQFLVTAGRYPSTSSSDLGERRTAKWLNSQKSAARRGSSAFTDERRAYLTQAVPLWADRHPTHQSQPDERWLAIAAEYGDFFIVHARHPFVGAVEEDERRLNSWATVQRAEARSGEPWLTAERLTVLAQVIPGWGGREPRQVLTCRWRAAAEELREFVNTASRLPSSAADDEFERQIGTWLECQSRGPLSEGHDHHRLPLRPKSLQAHLWRV